MRDFDEAAEAFLALLVAHGSSYVFINPGTDTFPIQEAWAKRREQGLTDPIPIMCTHEHTAVAAAHGYFLASGQTQTVMVHVDAGTQNVGGALHNAQRSEAGLVLCAGRAPYTWDGQMRGGKDVPIHFWQEQVDQASIVRNYVKWHYELTRSENIAGVLERAFQVAANEPAGPVYLMLPREVLMQPALGVRMPDQRRMGKATPASPDLDGIRRAAEVLARAERPLIIASQNGRNPATMAEVPRLAEQIGARIVDNYDFASVPGSHPLNLGPNLMAELPRADVIVLLDPNVPWVPNLVRPASAAAIIQIDRDPLHQRWAFWPFPVDVRITSSVATALPALRLALDDVHTAAQRATAAQRREDIALEHRHLQDEIAARARSKASTRPMDPEWVAWCLAQVLPKDAILLEDAITNRPWVRTHLSRDMPGTIFTPGGSSLGWAMNAAIGVKLAQPDRTVVSLMGDGGFSFANPVAALWTALKAGTPTLTVLFNNACYNASKYPIIHEMYPGGAVARANDGIVTAMDPQLDYDFIVRGCGALGITVHDPAELEPALRRALDAVQHGQSAVLNAVLRPA